MAVFLPRSEGAMQTQMHASPLAQHSGRKGGHSGPRRPLRWKQPGIKEMTRHLHHLVTQTRTAGLPAPAAESHVAPEVDV